MVSVHRQLKRSSALSSTDEFWLSPVTKAVADDSSSCSSSETSSLPPVHHQLLSDDNSSYECLTGYDHTEQEQQQYGSSPYDSLDSYTSDAEEDVPSCFRHKVSSVKQQGGGSWLLGFARLTNNDDDVTVVSQDDEDEQPGLVRVSSRSSFSDSSDDDESVVSSPTQKPTKRSRSKRAGVSFATEVKVQPIPHSSTLSPVQRRKMYSTSYEVRQNKIRNKREYRHDGYDWRNVTEEWEMGVDMVTGELIHPVHEH